MGEDWVLINIIITFKKEKAKEVFQFQFQSIISDLNILQNK